MERVLSLSEAEGREAAVKLCCRDGACRLTRPSLGTRLTPGHPEDCREDERAVALIHTHVPIPGVMSEHPAVIVREDLASALLQYRVHRQRSWDGARYFCVLARERGSPALRCVDPEDFYQPAFDPVLDAMKSLYDRYHPLLHRLEREMREYERLASEFARLRDELGEWVDAKHRIPTERIGRLLAEGREREALRLIYRHIREFERRRLYTRVF